MGLSEALYRQLMGKYPEEYYDFKDGNPVLKQGYSTSGAIGGSEKVHTIKGSPNKYQRWGGGKDSYKWTGGTPDINIYKLPGQQAAPEPDAAPAASAPAPLMPQISAASQQYRAEFQALSDKIAKQQADFNASQAAAAKAKAIAAANQSRSGQTANLQIQPASSTPKTAGTQTFKKRRIASNRKQQLTSGINLGTSSLLNI